MTLLEAMQQVKVNDPIVKTYVVKYYYTGECDYFQTHIDCECLEEAIRDAKSFVNERNAQVAGKPKVGNYINRIAVYAYNNMWKENAYIEV